MRTVPLACLLLLSVLISAGCGGGSIADGDNLVDGDADPDPDPDSGLPDSLPFAYSRPSAGEPLSEDEVALFTRALTSFYQRVDFFSWVYETCHGVDASTGLPDYLIWWHDVDAVKQGDLVTFTNASRHGGSHNNAEPTGSMLTGLIGGYLLTGDPEIGRVVEGFAKSFSALFKGFLHDAGDPEKYILSRNITAMNHEFVLPSGRRKAVDYTDWHSEYTGWNADRFNYTDNPYWGDIWVTGMRSKDDVPYWYRAAAWFPYLIEYAPDPGVRAAAAEALDYMIGFAKDIVAHGWHIRSKDKHGVPYIPEQDLASFVDFVDLIPDAECDARLATALLAEGESLGIECGSGQGSGYDRMAGAIHYFNYAIVDHFHLAAIHLALTAGKVDAARALLEGFATRIERYRDPASDEPGADDPSWERDIALLLLEGASLGLPLTAEEARLVQRYHLASLAQFEAFPNWNLWDPSVPDGVYDFRSGFHPAHTSEAIRVEDFAYLLEYCWSPFRNPAGARFIDCDLVADRTTWEE